MHILAFETSCDETAASVVRSGREVISNIVLSQTNIHALYGGVVPELASRAHAETISRLASEAVAAADLTRVQLDAIAVSYAPGLIGALLVGVSFAKSAALALGIPLIPVHHIRGHIAANYIAYPELEPPFLALVISGGHSLIVDVSSYTDMRVIGGTRDDAAGECFDKIARVMGLGYPGGAPLDRLAVDGDDTRYPLPRSVVDGYPYDMSFSGLKTSVLNLLNNAEQKGEEIDMASLAASFSAAVSDTLLPRTMRALSELGYDKLAVAGGVAANSRIRGDFTRAAEAAGVKLYLPPLYLCGDNAAMIGAQAYYEFLSGNTAGSDLDARASLEL